MRREFYQVAIPVRAGNGQWPQSADPIGFRQRTQLGFRSHSFECVNGAFRDQQVARCVYQVRQGGKRPAQDAVISTHDSYVLDARLNDLDIGEPEFDFRLHQKSGLAPVAVEQGEPALGKPDRQGNSGKSGTATHVQKAIAPQVGRYRQTVDQVAINHGLAISHRGKVVHAIPAVHERQVIQQLQLASRTCFET